MNRLGRFPAAPGVRAGARVRRSDTSASLDSTALSRDGLPAGTDLRSTPTNRRLETRPQ
jgi:hypothetical protein